MTYGVKQKQADLTRPSPKRINPAGPSLPNPPRPPRPKPPNLLTPGTLSFPKPSPSCPRLPCPCRAMPRREQEGRREREHFRAPPAPFSGTIFSGIINLFLATPRHAPPQRLICSPYRTLLAGRCCATARPGLAWPGKADRSINESMDLAGTTVRRTDEAKRKGSASLQAVDLAELASSHNRPLQVVAVGRLEIEGAVMLLRVAVQRAEHVVAPARDARVAHLRASGAVRARARRRPQNNERGVGIRAELRSAVKCRAMCGRKGRWSGLCTYPPSRSRACSVFQPQQLQKHESHTTVREK